MDWGFPHAVVLTYTSCKVKATSNEGKKGRKMQCFKSFKSMLSFECVLTVRVLECICKHSHWKYKEYLGVRETHNNR